MSKFSSALSSISHSAAMKASQPISSAVREMATNAGWPEHVISQMSVAIKDGKLMVSYPPSISKQVMDLEYGTETEPPKSVLRRFDHMLPELLQPHLERELEARMSEVVSAL